MTQQQIEERKAEQEVFRRLRATRRKIHKEEERIGLAEYNARSNRQMIETMEEYCRQHPGYQIVQVGGGYLLKKPDGTTQQ
jgi:ElaB/YqjD/DUF883 family membrane-anchored ribosome-binding protein